MSGQPDTAGEFSAHLAIVTGAASGIGRATAEAFARAGAETWLWDLNAEGVLAVAAELRDAGLAATGVAVDVTDDAAVDRAVGDVRASSRAIHLVNSAVNFVAAGPDATRAEWEGALGVNVIGSALLTAKVAREMPPGSTVVNISSISAHSAQPDRWTYNASKAAILALTRGQALDYRRRGIRVNAVSPGWIWTAEVAKAAEDGGRERWEPIWGRFHMLERLGEASEIADAVLYLSSPRAGFITGTELFVDGGYSSLGPEGLGDSSKFAGSSPRD